MKSLRRYENDQFGFHRHWDALLDIFDAFSRICEENGLRYYIVGGTLLGAIRHRQFIPWDDDFDVAMPRPDYEKFRGVVWRYEGRLKFVDHNNSQGYDYLFGKLLIGSGSEVEAMEAETGRSFPEGVYIDIFPIDGYPESRVGRLFCKFLEWRLHILYSLHGRFSRTRIGFARFGYSMMALAIAFRGSLHSMREVLCANNRYLQRYEFRDDAWSGVGGFMRGRFHLIFPPHLWGQGCDAEFCGMKMRVPEQWHTFLTINYGDYRTLPPPEQRVPSHAQEARVCWRCGPVGGASS